MAASDNVLGAALAAGIPLPHSCRAGRCAILQGEDRVRPGGLPGRAAAAGHRRVRSRARRSAALPGAAAYRSAYRHTRAAPAGREPHGVIVERTEPLALGGTHASLRILGPATPGLRPGKFVEVETAAGERERVPVVAATASTVDVEVHELAPAQIIRLRGPFDSPR